MKWILCLLPVLACTAAMFEETRPNTMERLKQVFEYVQTNDTLLQMYNEHLHAHKIARQRYHQHHGRNKKATFSCLDGYTPSTTMPTSVHNLRPEHVSVIAALGDSLTAGNGILGTNILDCLTEYRGRSWSIGGDLNFDLGVETLPNILKKYTHQLKGYSLGKCDTSNEGCSQLNVAVAGETSQELPAQATELVRRMHNTNYYGINYQQEWKVITLFIGGNDLCDYCHNSNRHSPANYVAKINETLKILYDNVPRAFVNLVEIFDIKPLAKVSQGFFCNLVTSMVCDCAKDNANNAMLTEASHLYQAGIQNLISTGVYNDKDDFAVVLQPFFRDTEPVKTGTGSYDLAYFAPDCFHFSDLGTNAAGKSLWNNMIEPIGQKQTVWHLGDSWHCPHTSFVSDGVFRTGKN